MGDPAVRATTASDHLQRVLRVLIHVERHLAADLSLAALARVAHLSPFHFQRVFRRLVGATPDALVRRLRLEGAARDLLAGDEPVREIARKAGMLHAESFTRAFRALFGRPPAAYRAAARARVEALKPPRALRVWLNRPGPEQQLRFVPVSLPAARRAGRPRAGFRIERVLPMRVAFLRRAGRAFGERRDFSRLAAFANRRGGPVEDPVFLVLHHDDPRVTRARLRRVDRCVVVGPRRLGEGDIGIQTVGGAEYCVATVAGHGVAAVDSTARWLGRAALLERGSPRRPGPVVEMLLHDPRRAEARGSRALVDVLVPVAAPALAGVPNFYWRRRRALAASE